MALSINATDQKSFTFNGIAMDTLTVDGVLVWSLAQPPTTGYSVYINFDDQGHTVPNLTVNTIANADMSDAPSDFLDSDGNTTGLSVSNINQSGVNMALGSVAHGSCFGDDNFILRGQNNGQGVNRGFDIVLPSGTFDIQIASSIATGGTTRTGTFTLDGVSKVVDGGNDNTGSHCLEWTGIKGGRTIAYTSTASSGGHAYLNAMKITKQGSSTQPPSGFDPNISTFIHPGIYHTHDELASVRAVINDAPYQKVLDSNEKNRVIDKVMADFTCNYSNAGDTATCNAFTFDMRNAEYWALRAYAEQDATLALKAVTVINDWASVYNNVTGHNNTLLKSWGLYSLARAMEILIHNDYGFVYPPQYLNVAIGFADKLMQSRPPLCQIGNNWTSAGLASFQAYWILKHGVATNNTDRNHAVAEYKKWAAYTDELIEVYIYMNSDGALPRLIDYSSPPENCNPYSEAQLCGSEGWRLKNDASCFQTDGLIQEYWRDLPHATMGTNYLAAMIEMSNIQKYIDLYTKYDTRITAAMEAVYGAALKHKGQGGSYMPAPCSGASTSLTTPVVSSTRDEANYHAAFYKQAKSKGWNIPFMEQYYTHFGFMDDAQTSKAIFDYTFKGIDI